MKPKSLLILIAAAATLAGCSGASSSSAGGSAASAASADGAATLHPHQDLAAVDGRSRRGQAGPLSLSPGRHRVRFESSALSGAQEKSFVAEPGHRYEADYISYAMSRDGRLMTPDRSAPQNVQRGLIEAFGALGLGTSTRIYVVVDRTTQRIASDVTPTFQKALRADSAYAANTLRIPRANLP